MELQTPDFQDVVSRKVECFGCLWPPGVILSRHFQKNEHRKGEIKRIHCSMYLWLELQG